MVTQLVTCTTTNKKIERRSAPSRVILRIQLSEMTSWGVIVISPRKAKGNELHQDPKTGAWRAEADQAPITGFPQATGPTY